VERLGSTAGNGFLVGWGGVADSASKIVLPSFGFAIEEAPVLLGCRQLSSLLEVNPYSNTQGGFLNLSLFQ
jgi:hypothetical protein